ncbi:MAG TPA: hypothetical protein VLJ59_13865 [Mycobacteriales bacterium]|nr:hypothetical protein [Mycobacteriales bacterium]
MTVADDRPVEYRLPDAERREFQRTIDALVASGTDPGWPASFDDDATTARLLPQGLRRFLADFRRERPACGALAHGLPVRS